MLPYEYVKLIMMLIEYYQKLNLSKVNVVISRYSFALTVIFLYQSTVYKKSLITPQ